MIGFSTSMTDLPVYDRSQHEASCPCKLCIGYDILFAVQEKSLSASGWKPGALEEYLLAQRSRKLNWSLPSGHCLICGGTNLWAYNVAQHYQIARHNERKVGDAYLSSLLLHKEGGLVAVYFGYLKGSMSKSKLLKWASVIMDLLPEKCTDVAARDIGDWIELRLAFTDLVEENFDARISRYYRESDARYQNGNFSSSAGRAASEIQVLASMARGLDTVLASSPG